MTLTRYFGTYQFGCEQMQKLFFSDNEGYVDLYYNDTFSLSQVYQKQNFERIKTDEQKKKEITFNLFQNNTLNNMELRRIIYD